MSETTVNQILNLWASIDEHKALVEERIRKAGIEAEPMVVESIAKYWQVLEKLAAE